MDQVYTNARTCIASTALHLQYGAPTYQSVYGVLLHSGSSKGSHRPLDNFLLSAAIAREHEMIACCSGIAAALYQACCIRTVHFKYLTLLH